MPKDSEVIARRFYSGHLGLRELQWPKGFDVRDGVWFDAWGVALHVSTEDRHVGTNTQQHFGLGCGDVDGLKARLKAAGVKIENGPRAPWKRFFIRDPFGNRIEIHEPGEPHV